jgi:hypothetical protein
MTSFVMFLCAIVSGIRCEYTEPPFFEAYCVFMDGRVIKGGRELECPPEASLTTFERRW